MILEELKTILDEIKNIKSGRRDLRNFGLVMGCVLLIIAVIFLRGREAFSWLAIIGILFLFFGLVFPLVLIPLQKIWMAFSVVLGFFMSRLILIILFYTVITFIGFFLKLTGHDLLDLRWNKKAPSYWLPKKPRSGKTDYEKQF